jgi:hypothetical protein
MTAAYDHAIAPGDAGASLAAKALRAASVLWFLVAAAGQWAFVAFIIGFYGPPTVAGDFAAWDKNTFLTHGYVAGDTAGNLAFAAHVILAAIITFGATLQLVPQIRARAIGFHRWNGRLFVATAFVISLSGLFMNLTRGDAGMFDHAAITLNAVLIMFCVGQAYGYALARDIDTHRRWALRTFMVVNGVWMLRVGMMGWMIVKIGLFGGPKTFDANFYAFWSFGSYLVPLALLELYFRAQDSASAAAKAAMAVLVVALTAAMAAGIAGATAIIYWPLLLKAW